MTIACGRAVQPNALFLRKVKQLRRQFSSLVSDRHQKEDTDQTEPLPYNSTTWVPHPRTGIYIPKGHDWVMKDVPENAASLSRVCWFRDSDGIDDDGDLSPDTNPSVGPRFAAVFVGRE